jgi:hypothetical protein
MGHAESIVLSLPVSESTVYFQLASKQQADWTSGLFFWVSITFCIASETLTITSQTGQVASIKASMGDKGIVEEEHVLDITDGENERKIPAAKFIDDIGAFSESFQPPASAELLIGAYSELHNKYKTFEVTLTRKRTFVPC